MRLRRAHFTTSLALATLAGLALTQPALAAPRSHDPCGVNAAVQDACDAAIRDDLRYTCAGESAIDATKQGTGLYYQWEWTIYGFHSCPDNLGDWVRVSGTMQYLFDGVASIPIVCSGFQGCTNVSWGAYLGGPTAVVHVQTVTSTIDVPSGTSSDMDEYIL
ncbi:MAG: hypothetical protein QOJ98_2856 [Acidobacteriota bacterium]|jgi:hypothetical protein|nr:hypothetical protein [Acidobacteriota bacterium]